MAAGGGDDVIGLGGADVEVAELGGVMVCYRSRQVWPLAHCLLCVQRDRKQINIRGPDK